MKIENLIHFYFKFQNLLLWASVFMLLEECVPGSFAGTGLAQADHIRGKLQYFQYLSFVTITTLGYGDITPQTPPAMALCQLEAAAGQFFIAVFVARLVRIEGEVTTQPATKAPIMVVLLTEDPPPTSRYKLPNHAYPRQLYIFCRTRCLSDFCHGQIGRRQITAPSDQVGKESIPGCRDKNNQDLGALFQLVIIDFW